MHRRRTLSLDKKSSAEKEALTFVSSMGDSLIVECTDASHFTFAP